MLYQVTKASKYYGVETVFEDVNFEIRNTEKIAIVGRNGSGKTTFLRCMCEEESFDKANMNKANDIRIGYLAQKVIANDEVTVREELMSIYEPVFALEKRMRELEERMASEVNDAILKQYADMQERFEVMGGYQWEAEMKTVFSKFGFSLSDMEKKIGEFSGGQKTRIAFAKLLLSKPDILLLDEPTNHLDVEAIEWLEGYIRNYPKAVVLVSHDRMFLDRIVEVVYDLEFSRMKKYSGNYSSFVEQKKNDMERNMRAYERQQEDIARLQALIEKFRYKKNKAAFAQSKIKYLDRMEKIELDQSDEKVFHAKFTPNLKGGEKVLSVDHLQIGYDHVLTEVS
ncbi:MAG: ABC-F family ATP-binding cassette domain-containing protein, partial [Solobacterium sp.]|nr:ABC-F family ATP-binding cassette domain-containing protein [Solobacterium sp.]